MSLQVSSEVVSLRSMLLDIRRDLHRHPELGFQEIRTAGIAARILEELGCTVRIGLGKTGVIGVLRGGQPGRTVLIRQELDALPIQEEVEVPWKSCNPGVMHACGHDANVAAALVAAHLLAKERSSLSGDILFVFQPAEEMLSGAAAMLRDGVLEGVRGDACLSVHLDNERPTGTVAVCSGPLTTSADRLELTVTGRGGHGANPHLTVDPVLASAHMIAALQALVSRETPPLMMAVLSLTTLKAGTAFNIIPDTVDITGTFRCYDGALRETLLASFQRTVQGIAQAFRCTVQLKNEWLTPAMFNDPTITEVVRQAGREIVGVDRVVEMEPLTGSDDLAHFRQHVPGCHVFVGSAKPDGPPAAPHHNARFDIDESAMEIEADLLVRAARRILRSP